ncbi:restriction endonuclease [Sinorhizobium meliloti]|uniref:restriction endonuclease n=1 Tax=Rhizobium meliloti TaxID=382 RepID=UPI001F25CC24|nr:restriction endonuclease [Sinorhizobium meliloti]
MFDGLGFKVTLTPGSRDGGKDVILECEFAGSRQPITSRSCIGGRLRASGPTLWRSCSR